MKKIKSIILMSIMLIFFSTFNGEKVKSLNSLPYQPPPATNFTAHVNYLSNLKYATINITWNAPSALSWQTTVNGVPQTFSVDDTGYLLFRSESFDNKTYSDEIKISEIDPGNYLESLNFGGMNLNDAEILGNVPKWIKYRLVAWDKSVGLTDDINNHISSVSTTVEIKSKNDVCAAQ